MQLNMQANYYDTMPMHGVHFDPTILLLCFHDTFAPFKLAAIRAVECCAWLHWGLNAYVMVIL